MYLHFWSFTSIPVNTRLHLGCKNAELSLGKLGGFVRDAIGSLHQLHHADLPRWGLFHFDDGRDLAQVLPDLGYTV